MIHIEKQPPKIVLDWHEVYVANNLDFNVYEHIKKHHSASTSESLESEHTEDAF